MLDTVGSERSQILDRLAAGWTPGLYACHPAMGMHSEAQLGGTR